MVSFRIRMQVSEALGSVNRWYCSEAAGETVTHPNMLLEYFIKKGGAEDFSRRFEEAMGPDNRWYCSQHYGREVREPEVLWEYYMSFRRAPMSIAC